MEIEDTGDDTLAPTESAEAQLGKCPILFKNKANNNIRETFQRLELTNLCLL